MDQLIILDGVKYQVMEEFVGTHKYRIKVVGFDEETLPPIVNIPEFVSHWTVYRIEDYAFYRSEIEEITIPPSVVSIGESAFEQNYYLRRVDIPHTIEEIGERAFYACSELQGITIPDSVMYIGPSAFEDCISITSVKIGDGIETIYSRTFAGCHNLRDIIWGRYLKDILNKAFGRCESLEFISLPDTVTSLGDEVFAACKNLITVCLPKSIRHIGHLPFKYCNSIKSIYSLNPVPPKMWDSAICESQLVPCTLFIPSGCRESYLMNYYWNTFMEIEEIIDEKEIPINRMQSQGKLFVAERVKKEVEDFPSYQELISFSLAPPYFMGVTIYLILKTQGDFAIDFGDGVLVEYSPKRYFKQLYEQIIESYDGEYCSDEDLQGYSNEIEVNQKSKGRKITIYGKQYITHIDFSAIRPDSVDVSNNKGLESLVLAKCYDIKSLDLSKNCTLKHLDCSSTEVSELDLTNNTQLETLDCSNTDVVELDLSKHVLLKELYCSNTSLISIDLRNNLKLTTLSLNDCHYLQRITLHKDIELEYYDINTIDSFGGLTKDKNNMSNDVVIFRK